MKQADPFSATPLLIDSLPRPYETSHNYRLFMECKDRTFRFLGILKHHIPNMARIIFIGLLLTGGSYLFFSQLAAHGW